MSEWLNDYFERHAIVKLVILGMGSSKNITEITGLGKNTVKRIVNNMGDTEIIKRRGPRWTLESFRKSCPAKLFELPLFVKTAHRLNTHGVSVNNFIYDYQAFEELVQFVSGKVNLTPDEAYEGWTRIQMEKDLKVVRCKSCKTHFLEEYMSPTVECCLCRRSGSASIREAKRRKNSA